MQAHCDVSAPPCSTVRSAQKQKQHSHWPLKQTPPNTRTTSLAQPQHSQTKTCFSIFFHLSCCESFRNFSCHAPWWESLILPEKPLLHCHRERWATPWGTLDCVAGPEPRASATTPPEWGLLGSTHHSLQTFLHSDPIPLELRGQDPKQDVWLPSSSPATGQNYITTSLFLWQLQHSTQTLQRSPGQSTRFLAFRRAFHWLLQIKYPKLFSN